ncbi:MAG: hypothetical protein ABEJ40_10135 [Haloarculaceae archaeon]
MADATAALEPHLLSRIVVTWIELTAVGFAGAYVGASVGGPPGLVVYLATTLLSVGVIFYNVNELIDRRVGPDDP